MGFPGSSAGKESTYNRGDPSSIPGSGRSPGGEHSNPLQYSCLENSMDRGARELDMTERQTLSLYPKALHFFFHYVFAPDCKLL